MAPRAHRSATHKFHQRRDTIVRAAVEVLNHKGVRGMTLADVAAKIDLVPTAVMYYFHKKEDLAAACFHKAIEQYEHDRAGTARPVGARGAGAVHPRLLRVPPADHRRRSRSDRGVQRRARRTGPRRRRGLHADVPQRAQPAAQVAGNRQRCRAWIATRARTCCSRNCSGRSCGCRAITSRTIRASRITCWISSKTVSCANGDWQPRVLHEVEPPLADRRAKRAKRSCRQRRA